MSTQNTRSNITVTAPAWRRPAMIGVSLLAGLCSVAVLAAGVEKVRDAADRMH